MRTGGASGRPNTAHKGGAVHAQPQRTPLSAWDAVDCLRAHGGAANCTGHVLFESTASLSKRLRLAQTNKVTRHQPLLTQPTQATTAPHSTARAATHHS
jgi:hypothetical protein